MLFTAGIVSLKKIMEQVNHLLFNFLLMDKKYTYKDLLTKEVMIPM